MQDEFKKQAFHFFLRQDAVTGLVPDRDRPGAPASITVNGFAISVYICGVENGWLSRSEGRLRILRMLRFFHQSRQGNGEGTSGYQGFYYHFLDTQTGLRTWNSELSTIDTGFLMAGILSAAVYFDSSEPEEIMIRELALELYSRVNWQWALSGGNTLSHGWKPGAGFLRYRWNKGYNEALLLYVLALGAPVFPIPNTGYKTWTDTFELISLYQTSCFYAGPLFIHQLPHCWIDFRKIKDAANYRAGFDYFENSRRATFVHHRYGIDNPLGFKDYGPTYWGITASDGPGKFSRVKKGKRQYHFGYKARGAPFGPDDGTVSPAAVIASIAFAPELVLPVLEHLQQYPVQGAGLTCEAINFSIHLRGKPQGPWICGWQSGLGQGPVMLMIQNFEQATMWKIMQKSPFIIAGLRAAGFSGDWLDD